MVETSLIGAGIGMMVFKKEVFEYVESLFKEKNAKKESFYTVEEVAEKLNLKVSRVRTAIFRKELTHIKLGALVRISEKHMEQWLRKNEIKQNS